MGFNKLNTSVVFEDQEYNILLNIALLYGRRSTPDRSERNVCKLFAECIFILHTIFFNGNISIFDASHIFREQDFGNKFTGECGIFVQKRKLQIRGK